MSGSQRSGMKLESDCHRTEMKIKVEEESDIKPEKCCCSEMAKSKGDIKVRGSLWRGLVSGSRRSDMKLEK